MDRKWLMPLVLFSFFALLPQSFAQNHSVDRATAVKQAKLVLVARASPVINGYSKPDPNNPEAGGTGGGSCEAIFDVLRVLKGSYREKTIHILYADHMGFRDRSRWLLIADDNVNLLSTAERRDLSPLLKKWPTKYVSSPDWLVKATDQEIRDVKQSLQTSKTGGTE
jgi:hypothetical protein